MKLSVLLVLTSVVLLLANASPPTSSGGPNGALSGYDSANQLFRFIRVDASGFPYISFTTPAFATAFKVGMGGPSGAVGGYDTTETGDNKFKYFQVDSDGNLIMSPIISTLEASVAAEAALRQAQALTLEATVTAEKNSREAQILTVEASILSGSGPYTGSVLFSHTVEVDGPLVIRIYTPANSVEVGGITGEITRDANYLYVHVGAANWKRSAVTGGGW